MERKIQFVVLLFALCLFTTPIHLYGQDNYKYEVGGMLGTSFYMGDANKTKLFQDPGFSAGAVFRYNIDLDWAIKNNLLVGHISGDTRSSNNAFPHGQNIQFSRDFVELGSQIEFNFFSYSDSFQYLGAKRITPYIFTGLGFTYATGKKDFFNMNIPLGIGVKYKWKKRLNVGLEFSFRKLFGDSFDVTHRDKGQLSLDDPYKIKSSFFKNKDWYSLTMLSVTWDFGLRDCPCLNID